MISQWRSRILASVLFSTSTLAHASDQPNNGSARQRPNVLLILLDDVGFGQLSTFGGPYRTPNIDRLANSGLRYTNFHTTALCSPTRAALLTGRNHHSVGMATITETASDEPGYNGRIPKNAGTLAAILQDQGYDTYALGKWHLTPAPDSGPNGPFDHWPTSMGFAHWYGFQGADTDQWTPPLWSDTVAVEPPRSATYHLTTDLADHAVQFLLTEAKDTKPFFLYFAPGAGHAPHQVPRDWIERNRGRFDGGWDVAREAIFAKQKAIGLLPPETTLPPRNEAIAAWDSLSPDEHRLYARMQEVHAAFIEHTDQQIGRILDTLSQTGQLDNTLVVFTSDNGASGEGGLFGSINEFNLGSGLPSTLPENLAMIDKLGGPETYNHYPAGWAQAGNTPFRYWKQETHEGGVHDPMIIAWPAGIKDRGGVRAQFEHVIDITPTILEAVGLSAPTKLNGLDQMPIEGTSMVNTFASATAPSAKSVQYYEMLGNRGIWSNGWKAVAFHGRYPWEQGVIASHPYDQDHWELYNVNQDPTESHDLAQMYPDKLKDLQSLFAMQASQHQVYPLDDTSLAQRLSNLIAKTTAQETSFTYTGPTTRIPESKAPWVKLRSHTITVDVDIPAGGADGALVAQGGRFGGYALFIKDGKLTYAYNFLARSVSLIQAPNRLPEGHSQLRFEFKMEPKGDATTRGLASLFVNDALVAEGVLERTIPGVYGFLDSFDVGSDTTTPVAPAVYDSPFVFGGHINKVTITSERNDSVSDFASDVID